MMVVVAVDTGWSLEVVEQPQRGVPETTNKKQIALSKISKQKMMFMSVKATFTSLNLLRQEFRSLVVSVFVLEGNKKWDFLTVRAPKTAPGFILNV